MCSFQRLDEERAEFGMLAADPEHRGTGIGRELVHFAERTSAENDAILMQLELLVPRTWRHPSKVFLKTWYERTGYELVRIGTIDEGYPDLAPLLTTACDFLIYTKKLGTSERPTETSAPHLRFRIADLSMDPPRR